MHCKFFLLAVSLIADPAFANPCKPKGTNVTSTVESSVTVIVDDTTTAAASETTSESSATTEVSVTTTLEASTTATTPSEATTVTSGAETSLATTSEAETTTDSVSTSTAPAANPTYVLIANGGNLNNQQPQSNIELTSALIFDPASPMTGGVRTFTIEPITDRLKDANGEAYVCAYYEGSRGMSPPPLVGYCNPENTGPNKASEYLKCQVDGGALSCSVPRTTCEGTVCTTPAGNDVYDKFFTDANGAVGGKSYFWYIGTGSPVGITPFSITVAEV
ncbi:hypothetical protein FMUND_3914 [Fusarium mundagurra]|uniref:Uncharacterized protein n=1 Tax=Fusarium mundagurra TaxID=1567541 RepID=A0A8H5Z0P0_9HYPO|nr:hypothetical protein FMUND_3914 [Fusarium mundagurra]